MMYEKLYQYLIQHKLLVIPGIGTFVVERKPAQGDFANKQIHSPVYAVSFNATLPPPVSKNFFIWLGNNLSVSTREAVIRFNDFAFDMKKQISDGATINWTGIGTLRKGLAEGIKFIPSAENLNTEQPVSAEKVIRENAMHSVRVGEEEKTSTQMIEMLNPSISKRSFGLVYPIIVMLAAILFIAWYFLVHGLTTDAAGNTSTLSLPDAAGNYKIIP
jgi:hypothetical protein